MNNDENNVNDETDDVININNDYIGVMGQRKRLNHE